MALSISSLSAAHLKNRSPSLCFLTLFFFPSLLLFSLLFVSKRPLTLSPPSNLALSPPQSHSPPPILPSPPQALALEPRISASDLLKGPEVSQIEVTVGPDPVVEEVSEIEAAVGPDLVAEEVSEIEAAVGPDPVAEEVSEIEAAVGPDPVVEKVSEIELEVGPDLAAEVGDGDGRGKECNLYEGRWERDEEGRYPLYAAGSCPHVDDAFTCQENGRPDRDYLKWRWKPDDCELPRFDATDFLKRLRGKRLMLVGDSMNRNQFESILCLLREGLPDKSKMYETQGHVVSKGRGYFNFLFEDYNCTIEFVRSHFLARQGTRVNGKGGRNPILQIDRVDKLSNRWKKADILVFNTGHWWTHGKTARGTNYYQEGDILYPKFDATEAFKRAMKTWGRWIDENIDHRKTLVFYRGYSAAHFRGGDWDSGGTCKGETEPVVSGAVLDSYPLKMKIVEEVIREMKFPVILLNVTKLTNFRKDGHPSIYGVPPQKVSRTRRRQDCSHWCLPGVPDAWNELIYATLVLKQYRVV